MFMNLIHPESRFNRLHFSCKLWAPICTVLPQSELPKLTEVAQNSEKDALRHSRSFIGTNQMGVYDLLLVTNSRCGYILLSEIWRRNGQKSLLKLILPETRSTGYISVADCVYLSPLYLAWWAAKRDRSQKCQKDAISKFKVVQGHRI